MKAKQKAKELVNRFNNKIDLIKNGEERQAAKRCALICVGEMMQVIPTNINPIVYMPLLSNLQEIKQEIEKL